MATIQELFDQNEAKRQTFIHRITLILGALHAHQLEAVLLVTEGLLSAQDASEENYDEDDEDQGCDHCGALLSYVNDYDHLCLACWKQANGA